MIYLKTTQQTTVLHRINVKLILNNRINHEEALRYFYFYLIKKDYRPNRALNKELPFNIPKTGPGRTESGKARSCVMTARI